MDPGPTLTPDWDLITVPLGEGPGRATAEVVVILETVVTTVKPATEEEEEE